MLRHLSTFYDKLEVEQLTYVEVEQSRCIDSGMLLNFPACLLICFTILNSTNPPRFLSERQALRVQFFCYFSFVLRPRFYYRNCTPRVAAGKAKQYLDLEWHQKH